jgi:oxygen-independent coproporphyrinogen-3 oxidase
VIRDARRAGFRSINIDLMYGLPQQTVTSFAATLKTITELEPDRIALYHYTHLPEQFPAQRRIKAEDLPGSTDKLTMLQNAADQLYAAGFAHIGISAWITSPGSLTN